MSENPYGRAKVLAEVARRAGGGKVHRQLPVSAIDGLREAYARDVIDLGTFERFVELVLAGRPVALPSDVLPFCRPRLSDEPGSAFGYSPWVHPRSGAAARHREWVRRHSAVRAGGLTEIRSGWTLSGSPMVPWWLRAGRRALTGSPARKP